MWLDGDRDSSADSREQSEGAWELETPCPHRHDQDVGSYENHHQMLPLPEEVIDVRIEPITAESRRITIEASDDGAGQIAVSKIPAGEHAQFRCAICGEPVAACNHTFPFCSQRCRLVDLGKWLKGAYAVSRPFSEEDFD